MHLPEIHNKWVQRPAFQKPLLCQLFTFLKFSSGGGSSRNNIAFSPCAFHLRRLQLITWRGQGEGLSFHARARWFFWELREQQSNTWAGSRFWDPRGQGFHLEKAGCSELCRFGGQVGVQLSEAGSFWGPREQRMWEKELGFIFFVRRLSQGDWCLLTSWTGHTGRCCKLRAALVEAVQRRGHWGLWFF